MTHCRCQKNTAGFKIFMKRRLFYINHKKAVIRKKTFAWWILFKECGVAGYKIKNTLRYLRFPYQLPMFNPRRNNKYLRQNITA